MIRSLLLLLVEHTALTQATEGEATAPVTHISGIGVGHFPCQLAKFACLDLFLPLCLRRRGRGKLSGAQLEPIFGRRACWKEAGQQGDWPRSV